MWVGDNIKDIREFEKNFKRSYVAEKLNISSRAYANIENNIADVTLNRLKEIADILECTPLYILTYKDKKREFYNAIHNNEGNKGTIMIHQAKPSSTFETIYELQKELIENQRKHISLSENLLNENNIEF